MVSDTHSLLKGEGERKLPPDWQRRFDKIVASLVDGCFEFGPDIGHVEAVPSAEQERLAENISAYGDALKPLHPAVWRSSIYAWANDHWVVLVDLSTEKELVSDLVLHARIFDTDPARIVLDSIHVP